MIFEKAKKAENVEVPASIYIRNETKNLVNKLVFTPAEAYNPPVIYSNTTTVRLPGSEIDRKEFDSIEHIVDPSKGTIPICVGSRKLAKGMYYCENPKSNLVPTEIAVEGLDTFFSRVMDTIIHYRLKGYNIRVVNGIYDSNYEPIKNQDFDALKSCLGFEDKVK